MQSKIFGVILAGSIFIINAIPFSSNGGESVCGYEGCPQPKSEMINVHIVPHTHDDVGWLKTVDQYYYGSQNRIQKAAVEIIIDSVIDALLQDPNRRFIYVESAFFSKWWYDQDEEMQQQVRMLVNEGRLEFIGGAWSMNDEAATHYQCLIDQFTLGLSFLNDNFGECGRPKIGWQIDPFGHSREQASLFTKMGYDGLFFARLDWRDKWKRANETKMEMIWHTSQNLDDSDLFTGVLYSHYGPPPGFCFDVLCDDEPIIDDYQSADYNVEDRVKAFADFVKKQALSYRTDNVVLTMGGDFNYMSAQTWFKNLDKLIKYTNERQAEHHINAFYSTPSCYLKALYDANKEWPVKTDDFFPLGNDPHTYWTGYYTSRPTSKRFERMGNQFLQICKKLSAIATTPEDHYEENLLKLKSQMGVMQHHDAITGTEKQHVADDYHRELYSSIVACEANTRSSLNQLVTGMEPSHPPIQTNWEFRFQSCLKLNISECDVSEKSEKFMVTVYNPLGHSTDQFLRFPVDGDNYEVRDQNNNVITSQLVPIAQSIKDLNQRTSDSTIELVFQAKYVPPMGYQSYFISRLPTPQLVLVRNKRFQEPVTIGSDKLSITFNENGLLSSILIDGMSHNLSQNFVFYRGSFGDNMEFANRSSGAYIFRPDPLTEEEIVGTDVTIDVIKGDLVDEVHQVFNDWISQVVRVYKTGTFSEHVVEFEWLVGPISINDTYGKEIVSRFYSDIKNGKSFYTDSNGREVLKRTLDYRETFDFNNEEKVAGNYYPINSNIAIEDNDLRMAVLPDRAQGGSSLIEGTLELMVHRRLLNDDAFGVEEALNEQEFGQGLIARGKHSLVFGTKKVNSPTLKAWERMLQNEILMSNWPFFDDVSNLTFNDWLQRYNHSHTSIGIELPSQIYLMTFEPWKSNSYLIRFEHIMDKDDDPELSKAVSFNIAEIFPGKHIFWEMNLAANQRIEDLNRLHFIQENVRNKRESNSDHTHHTASNAQKALGESELLITLNPMQIRTFIMAPTSVGVISTTIFKLFPLLLLAVIVKNII